jgi:small acid-soluble spore protein H (minor)
MDMKRARQILDSADTIEVLHSGSPVWIESLKPDNNTAIVKPLDGRGAAREVPVTELVES